MKVYVQLSICIQHLNECISQAPKVA